MSGPIVLCTDGSESSDHALKAGLSIIVDPTNVVLVTVINPPDPSLVVGTGFASGTMTPEEFDALEISVKDEGSRIIDHTKDAVGLADVDTKILTGEPASSICDYAEEIDAAAIVMGTRGRGGIKRALLGSVSDYVVRHATRPVVVTGPHLDEND
jgi:nucleotide-binding universal stress UspA family protein